MFVDRTDAGRKLARKLEQYRNKNTVILAIPRGGVPVALEVSNHLDALLSVLIARKLPFPSNPEAGFGAIAEDGSTVITDFPGMLPDTDTVESIKREQIEKTAYLRTVLRRDRPIPNIGKMTVILIDDGIAMGSTMRAAIRMCRALHAGAVIAASPVSGSSAAELISGEADETVILEMPSQFHAVAQVYQHWRDMTDQEVIEILANAKNAY
ncbi:MAG: phosphoribosyltransferase [Spirochaetota bacterium]